jgi:4-carboxymuconolactone decarboxylase
MNNEILKRGIDKINELVPGGDVNLVNGLGEIAPDMADYVLKYIFGELYSREGLELKTKQIITITTLAALGNAKPQLAYHIKAALNIGITRKEIIDIMIHISGYAGFPASLNGIATAKEVFKERDEQGLS